MALEDVSKGGNNRPSQDVTIVDRGEVRATSLGRHTADAPALAFPVTRYFPAHPPLQ